MQALDIAIEYDPWNTLEMNAITEGAIQATLTHLGLEASACEVSVLACDDAQIMALNTDFRGKPQPTNVLSWPCEERGAARDGARPLRPQPGPDGMIALGDIAISYDTCAAEAATAGKPISAHVTHLIVHGTLHLLGYDHIREGDADLMEATETEILGNLGLDDPYCTHAARIAASL